MAVEVKVVAVRRRRLGVVLFQFGFLELAARAVASLLIA